PRSARWLFSCNWDTPRGSFSRARYAFQVSAARRTRPTCRAAPTRAARVFLWLRRKALSKLRTQAVMSGCCLAVPPRRCQEQVGRYSLTRDQLGREPPPFLLSCKTGDDSAHARVKGLIPGDLQQRRFVILRRVQIP